jgi:NADH-quinone oxidoreductase subunit L
MQETISFTPQLGNSAITRILWLIPAVPVLASGAIAILKQPKRKTSSTLAIGSLGF